MSGKEINYSKVIWSAVRTGVLGLLTSLVLLLPAAWLVYAGVVRQQAAPWLALLAVAVGALLAQVFVNRRWGGGGLIGAILGGGVLFLLLLLLTAGMGGARWEVRRMLPAVAAGTLGMAVGSLIKINKKYSGGKGQRQKYNK